MRRYFQLIFFVILCLSIGCGSPESDAVSELKPYTAQVIDSLLKGQLQSKQLKAFVDGLPKSANVLNEIQGVYASNNYQLLWQDKERDAYKPILKQAVTAIKNAHVHGLNPEDYKAKQLNGLFNVLYEAPKQEGFKAWPIDSLIQAKIQLDAMTQAAALSFLQDVGLGNLKPKWDIKPRQFDFAEILADTSSTFQQKVDRVAPKFPGYYELGGQLATFQEIKKQGGWQLVSKGNTVQTKANLGIRGYDVSDWPTALKAFQKDNGLKATGELNDKTLDALNRTVDETINLIRLNLERYRWLPDDLGEEYIYVNVPDYKIQVYKEGKPTMQMKAVVGETITPTPVFYDQMEYLVFSPIWNIPQSIAREEIFKWIEINPGILYAGDTKVYYKGKEVNPFDVNWAEAKNDKLSYSFKQKPTNQNSLGDVKFIFPNKHSVYLHDTPAKKYFKYDYRALSSGCVRVEQPTELATYLLKDKEGWTIDRVKQNMAGSKERRVNLKTKVPVYIFYLTAWLGENGNLQIRKDIYKHDKKQLKQLD